MIRVFFFLPSERPGLPFSGMPVTNSSMCTSPVKGFYRLMQMSVEFCSEIARLRVG
jgi:hypothetical protein